MLNYEINDETMAIMPVGLSKTRVVELSKEMILDVPVYTIMEENCEYYGSTYDGRIKAAKNMLNFSYKLPLLVEESEKIIFFPTKSYTSNDCSWLNHNYIKKRKKNNNKTNVLFTNGLEIEFDISKLSFENQLLRAGMLESIISKRIIKK